LAKGGAVQRHGAFAGANQRRAGMIKHRGFLWPMAGLSVVDISPPIALG